MLKTTIIRNMWIQMALMFGFFASVMVAEYWNLLVAISCIGAMKLMFGKEDLAFRAMVGSTVDVINSWGGSLALAIGLLVGGVKGAAYGVSGWTLVWMPFVSYRMTRFVEQSTEEELVTLFNGEGH